MYATRGDEGYPSRSLARPRRFFGSLARLSWATVNGVKFDAISTMLAGRRNAPMVTVLAVSVLLANGTGGLT